MERAEPTEPKPRQPKNESVQKHLRTIRQRLDYLSERIRSNQDTERVLAWRCAEWNALHWALACLTLLDNHGGFKDEHDVDEKWSPALPSDGA